MILASLTAVQGQTGMCKQYTREDSLLFHFPVFFSILYGKIDYVHTCQLFMKRFQVLLELAS